MNKTKFNISSILPYIIGIAVFYIITFIYFQPELMNGKTLRQGDVMQYEGMSRKPIEFREKTGEQALWNDGMFAGMPDYLVSAGVPHQPLPFFFKVARGFLSDKTAAHLFFMSAFCFWITLLCFRVNPYLAIFGSLAFAFNTYNILNLEAGHVTQCWAIAFAPLVIAGMHLVFRGKIWLGAALFMIGFALHVRVPHYQITYYLAFVCTIYGISELVFAVKEKTIVSFLKKSVLLLIGVAIGAMVVLGRFWMVKEYEQYSIRGQSELTSVEGSKPEERGTGLDKEYAFAWSLGTTESISMLVPYFYGGASNETLGPDSKSYKTLKRLMDPQRFRQMASNDGIALPTYRGKMPFTGGPLYAGAIVCFLFVLSMLVLENRQRYWMLGAFIITLFISWGNNFTLFNYTMFDYFPAFNKFRTVMMALTLSFMLMPIASMLALQKILEEGWSDKLKKNLYIAFGVTGGLALFIAVLGGMFDFSSPNDAQLPEQLVKALKEDRLSLAQSDAFRSLILIGLSFIAIWLGLSKKISATLTFVIVGVLMVGDLWSIDKRYLKDDNFQRNSIKQFTQKTPADEKILKDKDPHYRVFNISPNAMKEARTSYFHKSLGGYFAAKLRRYQDIYERYLAREQQLIASTVLQENRQLGALRGAKVTNMLNAKWFIIGGQAVKNPYALGNAWFVESLSTVESADEEIGAIANIDISSEAVIDKTKFEVAAQLYEVDSTSSITLTNYSPKEIAYKTENTHNGFAVFSEIYYPAGWTATIDGQPTNIKRANFVLRALEIPAGNHEIKFSFNPASYERGSVVSQTGAILATVLALIFLGLHFFQSRQNTKQNE